MEKQATLQIVCIQTYLTQYHYQSYPILKQYLLQRIRLGLKTRSTTTQIPSNRERSQQPTLVILPECTGTWLYYMCVPMPRFLHGYFFNSNNRKANYHLLFIAYTLATHLRLFVKEIYKNYESSKTWPSIFRQSWLTLFARRTFSIYKQLFSELAIETNSTIVAGSIFAYNDSNDNKLYNMSYVFQPNNGAICLQSGKRYPTFEESDFIHSYECSPSIYSIPNTNIDIGILVCADSWMPEVYNDYGWLELNSHRRFLFIIVALNTGDWNMPWPGYDASTDVPNDVDSEHLQTYSLPQAWFHYAVQRAFDALSKRNDLLGYGVICCQGVLNLMNDIRAEGESVILLKRSKDEEKVLFEAKTCVEEKVLTCEF
ncbi:unnamed protein product [Adineta ricciae]|uniref:CN hydrolase domain-containing protein n=1 Tax=Adineta ricciae TaxID=249248 RepID=A0A815GLN5_ADIRI|nr:unnamed protein product [Adineta ricciae]CAF1340511.1 unnamed protein product [Adineta ricciae]